MAAAEEAFATAKPRKHNGFKIELGKRQTESAVSKNYWREIDRRDNGGTSTWLLQP